MQYRAWTSYTDENGRFEYTGYGEFVVTIASVDYNYIDILRWIGKRAYNLEENRGVRNTTFVVSRNQIESHYKLERYDLGREYDLNS